MNNLTKRIMREMEIIGSRDIELVRMDDNYRIYATCNKSGIRYHVDSLESWYDRLEDLYVGQFTAATLIDRSHQRVYQLGQSGRVRRIQHPEYIRWLYNAADLVRHRDTAKPGRPRSHTGERCETTDCRR